MNRVNYLGYTHLYNKLLVEYSHNSEWLDKLQPVTLAMFFVSILWYKIIGQQLPCSVFISYGSLILFTYGLLIYFLLVGFLAWLQSLDIKNKVQSITLNLLLFESPPYLQGKSGLDKSQIKHLQHIAHTEQNAADWRSSFINLVILGTASILLWIYTNTKQPNTEANQQDIWSSLAGDICQVAWTDEKLIPIFICTFLIIIAIVLFNYYRIFLSTEIANRAIIFACEEALALHEIQSESMLNTWQSSLWLANMCGYTLINKEVYLRRRSSYRDYWKKNHYIEVGIEERQIVMIKKQNVILINSSAHE